MCKRHIIILLLITGIILASIGFIMESTKPKHDYSLEKYYKKMQPKDGVLNGYILNVRLNGEHNGIRISQHVSIMNYMNKAFKIVETGQEDEVYDENGMIVQNALYYIDNVYYRLNNQEYKKVNETSLYNNTDKFITPLKKLWTVDDDFTDTIGGANYKTYNFVAVGEDIQNIINSLNFDIEIIDDVDGTLWTTTDGYIYKVVYNITDILTLSVSFSAIDSIPPIKLNNG